MKSFSSFHSSELFKGLRDRWSGLANREKKWLLLALVIVLGALLWLVLLAPAIATLRNADAQARTLDAQLGRMRALQLDAAALQKQPVQKYDEALRALTSATSLALGTSAKLTVAGDRASVTLQDGSADGLAQWLTEARVNAKSVPLEARLTRSPLPGAARWNGVVVMSLPSR
jgi:general secretion pathway protein M